MIPLPVPHYILAGGHSRRFGSDKARHLIDEVPMILRVRDAFAAVASATYAVAREEGVYADLGLETIADTVADAGPLGGLLTALTHCERQSGQDAPPQWLLVSSCDLVNPKQVDLATLTAKVSQTAQVSLFRSPDFFEPFPAFYRTYLRASVETHVAAEDRSMQRLFKSLESRVQVCPISRELDASFDLDDPTQA